MQKCQPDECYPLVAQTYVSSYSFGMGYGVRMSLSASGSSGVPRAPAGVDLTKTFQQISAWHQRWEIFEGVFTPGRNPVSALLDGVGLPKDLRGRRVLDVGAFNGCFSFE